MSSRTHTKQVIHVLSPSASTLMLAKACAASHVRDNHDADEAFLVYASTLVEAVLLDHSVRGEDLEGLMAILIERKRLIDEHRGDDGEVLSTDG